MLLILFNVLNLSYYIWAASYCIIKQFSNHKKDFRFFSSRCHSKAWGAICLFRDQHHERKRKEGGLLREREGELPSRPCKASANLVGSSRASVDPSASHTGWNGKERPLHTFLVQSPYAGCVARVQTQRTDTVLLKESIKGIIAGSWLLTALVLA